MSDRLFTNEQALEHLNYALTCGYSLEKFVSGRGVYGNRVSLVRAKDFAKLYTQDSDFKNSSFHIIEGKKALEQTQTILMSRLQLEAPLTNIECMRDFFDGADIKFLSAEDKEKVLRDWENVGRKLLSSNATSFSKLNNYVLGNIVLKLPISAQMLIADFRKDQVLALLTQDIISATDAKRLIDILPSSQENLVALKQKLLKQRDNAVREKNKLNTEKIVNLKFEPMAKTIQSNMFTDYQYEKPLEKESAMSH